MYSDNLMRPPGGPQQALIQALARSYQGGQPRTMPDIHVDGLDNSYTVPGGLTPYGRFHEPPEQGNPYANAGNVGAIAAGTPPQAPFHLPAPPDERSIINPGGPMQRLHPLIQTALDNIRSAPPVKIGLPDLPSQVGLGAHPQVDRFHAVHAQQALAAMLAGQMQRHLLRNQYGGRH